MATTEDRLVIRQLEAARSHLLARGDADAVKSLDAIIDRLGKPEPALEPSPTPQVVTSRLLTGQEAADLLGVRSVSMIYRWAEEGKIEFKLVDGRARFMRGSVEKLVGSELILDQRQFEAETDAALSPFDFTDEEIREVYPWWPRTDTQGASE
jgi:excisionase family DNA binding protein